MPKPRRPIVTVAALDVQCPECDEMISEPTNGSLFFSEYEYKAGMVLECFACHTTVKLPVLKTVKFK